MSARVLLALAEDRCCENSRNTNPSQPAPVGYCLTHGDRQVIAYYGADRACWPCTIAALLDLEDGAA